jgi:hypothetical protein
MQLLLALAAPVKELHKGQQRDVLHKADAASHAAQRCEQSYAGPLGTPLRPSPYLHSVRIRSVQRVTPSVGRGGSYCEQRSA